MKKIFLILSLVSSIYAANSTFSGVRTVSVYADGSPKEEALDITICLEKNPTPSEKSSYENIIRHLANGIYEATNGGNYLGRVNFYPKGRYCSSADIEWKNAGYWPSANVGGFLNNGGLSYSDDWVNNNDLKIGTDDLEFFAAMTLLHEMMHYAYSLLDEYPITSRKPNKILLNGVDFDYDIAITANPVNDVITITNKWIQNKNEFKLLMLPFKSGAPVVFFS